MNTTHKEKRLSKVFLLRCYEWEYKEWVAESKLLDISLNSYIRGRVNNDINKSSRKGEEVEGGAKLKSPIHIYDKVSEKREKSFIEEEDEEYVDDDPVVLGEESDSMSKEEKEVIRKVGPAKFKNGKLLNGPDLDFQDDASLRLKFDNIFIKAKRVLYSN